VGHTYTNLNYHIVFSTKDRLPLLIPQIQERVYKYMGGIVRDLDGTVLAAGGIADHVHLLCRLRTSVSLAEVMRQIKGSSSRWINEELKPGLKFAWQSGYSAFAVSQSHVKQVERYIAGQEEHHRKRGFKEEMIDFLEQHGIEYDEKHLWA
jgi:putative transposase